MIKIGDAVSMSDPTKETIIPDDRQTLVQTLNGVVVQDFGYIPQGNVISWELQFDTENFKKICGYWQQRKIVRVDDNGEIFNARIVLKEYSHVDKFRHKAVLTTIELWMV